MKFVLNVSAAVSRRRATHKQIWTPISAETLMGTAMDRGVTLLKLTPAGSTATYPTALVRFINLCVCFVVF